MLGSLIISESEIFLALCFSIEVGINPVYKKEHKRYASMHKHTVKHKC